MEMPVFAESVVVLGDEGTRKSQSRRVSTVVVHKGAAKDGVNAWQCVHKSSSVSFQVFVGHTCSWLVLSNIICRLHQSSKAKGMPSPKVLAKRTVVGIGLLVVMISQAQRTGGMQYL